MAQVHQTLRLGAQRLRHQDGCSPIGDDGGIECRLIKLVLDQHSPAIRQSCVDLSRRFQIPIERSRQILLTREIRAVANPHSQRIRTKLPSDFDAFDVVFHSLLTRRGHRGRKRSSRVALLLVRLILKGIRIHRIEGEPQCFGLFPQCAIVVDLVPGEVRRDPRRDRRELLDDPTIFKLFVNIVGFPREWKPCEARPAPSDSPTRNCYAERCDLLQNYVNIDAPPAQLSTQAIVFIFESLDMLGIVPLEKVALQ